MKKNGLVSMLMVSLVMILWGMSFLSTKVTVSVLSPMGLAITRFTIASVILLVLLKIREPGSKLAPKDIFRMAVSGVMGITVYFYFQNNGIKYTTAATASIIVATIPAFTVISDFIFFGNRLTLAKIIGVSLSFFGVYLIVRDSGHLSFSSEYLKGNLFMIGSACTWVIYSLVTRPLAGRYSKLAITTYQTVFGTLGILPFAFIENNNWLLVNGKIFLNIVFLGVFCSALGYYIYVYSIDKLGVDVVSLFINFIPVVTVISSYFILGEKITPAQALGGTIIIFAVSLPDLERRFKNRQIRQPKNIHISS